ncbi:MarR family winged helix-turn-helix transcriptional regulator [Actinoplanes sp. N902-109]|uniref:MarR family winged helix-turn-helix transcriptional regulator n=1 Tax=Actinoplanes sp. (strain N902-109) TaxID=649831 RepID=UPI00032950F0|nr:MarR family winged helix-turn-helix transcriptional regulator [Actinoplanes sp. N902-109]AGL16790.1 MarR family transcriptional regulator [Actinoplanes sp. N902-109]
MPSRSGADLALLLLGSYRNLVDEVVQELARRGYPDARPAHEYAMRAIQAGADNASELGRRLAVTKQAAAKTIAVLTQRGYVTSQSDPADARRKHIRLTDHGLALIREGTAIFDEVRARWEKRLGAGQLATLEAQLAQFVGDAPIRLDSPGWASQDLG